MTVFQPKWRDWTPEPPSKDPQESISGTFGTEAPIRPQTSTRGLIQQQQQQQQTNVINDSLHKEVSANEGLYIHGGQGARSARNKAGDGGEEAAQRPLPSPAWEPETAALIEWFLKVRPPAKSFDLYQGVTVLRPVHFWQSLKGDIAAGPDKARAYTGAFQKDLRRLAELFGGSDDPEAV